MDASLRLLLLASECVGEVKPEARDQYVGSRHSRDPAGVMMGGDGHGDGHGDDDDDDDDTKTEDEEDEMSDGHADEGEENDGNEDDEEEENENREEEEDETHTSSSPASQSPENHPRQWDRRFRGVQKVRDGQYKAVIWRSRQKRNVVLGVFRDPVAAAKAYDKV